MIPMIGLMIGAYVITRMFELLLKDHGAMGMTTGASTFVKVLSFGTIGLTVLCVLGLITSSASVPSLR